MRVLDVTEFFSERGGGVRSHLTLKGHVLCQLGHDHIIVAPGAKTIPIPGSRLIRVGGPSMPYDPSYQLLWRPDIVRAVVEREHPDVLEIHSPYVAAMGALACPSSSFGVRTFFWHSDFIDTYEHVLLERARLPLRARRAITNPLWAWVRRIGRNCDATIAAARWQVDKLRAHRVPNVVLLPFGVDKQVFFARERSEEVRASFGVTPTQRMLVAVGRFAIEKRWDVVIDAFSKVRESVDAKLVMIGDGPERARLERLAKGRDDIAFVGFVKGRQELATVLSSADALMHGCPYETFGISIAEAVCCGLPVVVPDQGGAAEQAHASFAETYVSNDPMDCARATLGLLARDPKTLRTNALEAATRIATVEEHFRQLIALYTELLAAKAGA
jgi:alpha-1,6-mannosyltransferase